MDGIYVENKASDDYTPQMNIDNMAQACSMSNYENLKISTIYQSTLAYQGVINGTIKKITDSSSQLSKIFTTRCGGVAGSDPFCIALNNGITTFNNLPTGDGGLNSMSNTLTNMNRNINSLYTSQFQPAYTGYKC
jgi:hypothetical protein